MQPALWFSALLERFGADPPLTRSGTMIVNATILHALVEECDIRVNLRNRVGQQNQIGPSTCGACGILDLQEAGRVRGLGIYGLAGQESTAGKDRDFPVLNIYLNSSLPSHEASAGSNLARYRLERMHWAC
jgi:hypothetical protein